MASVSRLLRSPVRDTPSGLPQHCSSSSFARSLLEVKLTGRLHSDIFLFPWLSRSFFLPLPTLLPPFLPQPALLPSLPSPPQDDRTIQENRGGGSYEENGPAQSPPSRLGLAVNPFLGGLAPAPAVEVRAEERRWPRAAVGPYLLLQLRGRLRAGPPPVHRRLHTGKPSQRWGSWEMAQILGPMLPEVRQLPLSVSADPPIPLPHPVLYLVLLSSRQEAENRHLKPTQALLSAPGTLQQLVWVLLPGWEGRVQWGGLSDKPEECAGQAGGGHCGSSHLALALGRSGWSVRALGLARTCGAPHPEHRQELITWRTSNHLGLGQRTKLDHTEGHPGAANMHREKGCRQGLSESGRLPDNEDSDLGGRCLSDDPVQHRFYIILQLGKRKLPRGDKQHGQGHTASPWFSQGHVSSRVGDGGRPAGGMPCHMALAACHHLSLLCHPGSEAGLCQQHGPPCLQDCWVGTEQYFWGQLGICAARTGPWGKHPAGAASSLALINLLEACRVPNKE